MTTISDISTAYDLAPPVTVMPIAGGSNNSTQLVQTGAGAYVWRRYRSHSQRDTVLYEHRLLAWLARQRLSFGVPVPLATRSGDTLVEADGVLHALFTRLPGTVPDRTGFIGRSSLAIATEIGRGLGELHRVLAYYPMDPRPGMFRYADLAHIHPLIPRPYSLTPADLGLPDSPGLEERLAWWREELARLRVWLDANYDRLPQQVIHGDVGPSNTLIEDGRLTGILDFDFALPDARAIDVASGLMFTMRHWENLDSWPIAAAFCQGYRQWIALTAAEVKAVPMLMHLRNAVSTVWWLGHGLADGDVTQALMRIQGMQEFMQWLSGNKSKLVEVVGQLD